MGAGQQTDADYEPGTRGQELHATDGGEVYPQETLQARTDLLSVRVNKKKNRNITNKTQFIVYHCDSEAKIIILLVM